MLPCNIAWRLDLETYYIIFLIFKLDFLFKFRSYLGRFTSPYPSTGTTPSTNYDRLLHSGAPLLQHGAFFRLQNPTSICIRFLIDFWLYFGCILGSKMELGGTRARKGSLPKSDLDYYCFFIDFGLHFGGPGEVKNLDSQRFSGLRCVLGPTWPQDHPRTSPRPPRRLPRPPQNSPKTSQTPPKTPPELPRTLPGPPQRPPKTDFQ